MPPTHIKNMQKPTQLELLAPARNAQIAIEAIRHGADAVYMGASSHGARSAATNSLEDIASVVDYAHKFNARIYVTLNTLIYDSELAGVEKLIGQLYTTGVDALIVQDLGILNLDIPPIALHASTQCDIRTPQKARFLQDAGFSQLVLPRELTLQEIADIRQATTVPLEAFVHGALCVSYSGDCQASLVATGRSANRGCCAQICRLPYSLTDANGRVLVSDKHLLSLRDMNRIDHLGAMIEAGISSFKIEGRLKDAGYVKNTVAAYRQALDSIIARSNGTLTRSSSGSTSCSFVPDLAKSFNRGFTSYFIDGHRPSSMASVETPKWVGNKIGTVTAVKGNRITIDNNATINNGDGLGFFNADNKLEGFRVNRYEGRSLFTAKPVGIKPGTIIYRNHDKAWDDMIEGNTAERTIGLDITLRSTPWGIAADATDSDGNSVSIGAEITAEPANTPQYESRRRTFSKLGDTVYRLNKFYDQLGNTFIPASRLTSLRRDTIAALDSARSASYRFDYRRPTTEDLKIPASQLTYHDNVANREAERFYRAHGATGIEKALEVASPGKNEIRVMTTRYCLRHEMGQCLRLNQASKWRGPLYLQAQGFRFRLDFDCRACLMHVIAERSATRS